jgi:hypothetical protein
MSDARCPHCGADHGPEARFCSVTGAAIVAAIAAPSPADVAAEKTLAGTGPGRPRSGSETIMMFSRPRPGPGPGTSSAAFDPTVKAPPHGSGSRPTPEKTIEEALPAGLRAAATAATAAPTATATIIDKAPLPDATMVQPLVLADATIAQPALMTASETPAAPAEATGSVPVASTLAEPAAPEATNGHTSQRISERVSERISGTVVGETSSRGSVKIPAWAISPDDGPDLDGGQPPAASALSEFVALVQRAFAIYADNLVPLATLAAVILGPPSLIASGLTAMFTQVVPNPGLLALNFVLTFLVMGAAWPLCTGAIAITVIGYLKGEPFVPRTVIKLLRLRSRALALALLPVGVAIALGYLLFVIPGIIAQIFFALVPTVVLLEGRQGGAALKRSATLIRDMLAPTVGILIGFGLLAFVVTRLITAILPAFAGLNLIVAAAASIAAAPLPMIALTLLYRRLHQEQDGIGDSEIVRTLRGD